MNFKKRNRWGRPVVAALRWADGRGSRHRRGTGSVPFLPLSDAHLDVSSGKFMELYVHLKCVHLFVVGFQ